MFDIGFWELALIGVIALFVVGPERLPGLVRSTGYWIGRFRQMANNVKYEIQEEFDKADKLKELMDEQENLLKRTEAEFERSLQDNEIDTDEADSRRPIPSSKSAPRPIKKPESSDETEKKEA